MWNRYIASISGRNQSVSGLIPASIRPPIACPATTRTMPMPFATSIHATRAAGAASRPPATRACSPNRDAFITCDMTRLSAASSRGLKDRQGKLLR
ncbi:hypothetical protein [Roseomonas sp. HF4]|uniref:hypothetical protein n=1 Tax=Roseomonas sp. HF4 TaxID=2562313 RepID=UPI00148504F7|nr:hypothetical protein [Roseomonas sp. HF4]